MNRLLTKILLPLSVLALIAVYLDSGSVKDIDLDSGYSAATVRAPQAVSLPKSNVARAKSRLAIGERYVSLDELVADQHTAGYLKTGYFGKYWPATVAEITSDHDGIVFSRQDGSKHRYKGFDGYRMKMVRLSDGARETIVIFRSVEKR